MDEDEQYLWPLSSSPLFIPQSPSPSPSPSAFTYDSMRRRANASPARRGKAAAAHLDLTKSRRSLVPQSHSSSFASGSGSGSGFAGSSAGSTPQSHFGDRAVGENRSHASGKRPAARSRSQSQRRISGQPTEPERPRKRRRVEIPDLYAYNNFSDSGSDGTLFGMRDGPTSVNHYHNDVVDIEAIETPIIDLTDDSQPLDFLEIGIQESGNLPSRSRSGSRVGSRRAPILIEESDDSPVLVRAAPVGTPQPQTPREPSIEVLENIVARQQIEAVAAQSKPEADEFTTFQNITCIICMERPRNLSMVPCGHIFCGPCITEALRHSESRIHEHSGQRKAACPVCRETVWRNRKDHIVPILLKKGVRRQIVEPTMG